MGSMAKRLILSKILIGIVLVAFVLGEVARVQFPNGIAIKALDIAVCLFALSSIVMFKGRIKRPRLTKPILIFSSAALLSLALNFTNLKTDELLVSFLYLLRWVIYAGVYFIVSNFDKNFKNKVPNMLVTVGGVMLSVGFFQYLWYPNLRNLYYLGWDEHLYRMFSTFLDPNFAGAFFVLYFLFVLDTFLKKRNKWLIILLTATFLGIILTFSRSAYLMLFAGSLTYLLFKGKKKLILGFVFLFVLAVSLLSMVGLKSEGTNLLRTASGAARIATAKDAMFIFKENPIFGVGFNAYQFASERYGFSKQSKYPDHAASGTDNSFLFILATTGLVGLGTYLYLLFKIISKSKKSAVIVSSFIALIFGSLFINSLFYTFIMLWMWILVGLSED